MSEGTNIVSYNVTYVVQEKLLELYNPPDLQSKTKTLSRSISPDSKFCEAS